MAEVPASIAVLATADINFVRMFICRLPVDAEPAPLCRVAVLTLRNDGQPDATQSFLFGREIVIPFNVFLPSCLRYSLAQPLFSASLKETFGFPRRA